MLHATNLHVSIHKTPVLKDISFSIPGGSCTGILGPNGSGKTTLMRAISGILPYNGALKVNDKEISRWTRSERARHLAVVQQSASIQFDFTVYDFVVLGRLPHKKWLEGPGPQDNQLVEQVMDDLALTPLRERLITTLSGGERQRALLAQSLVQEPSILLLDEPTTHLDMFHQLDFMKHIQALTAQGKTVIAVFHDLSMASRFTDHALILSQGNQVAFGKTDQILSPELIQDVFRIQVELYKDSHDQTHIHYKRTI